MNDIINRKSGDGTPFVVYASSSPVFSDRLLIWPHRKETLHWFEGTALLISGGTLEINRDSNGELPFMSMVGVVGAGCDLQKQFADRVLGALIEPDDNVLAYFHWGKYDMHPGWAESARAAGVEIIESGPFESGGGRHSGYVVCHGKGRAFPTDNLFANAGSGTQRLFATQEQDSSYVKAYIDAARAGTDIAVTDYKSWYNRPHHQPELALEVLGDYRLMAELEGPDYYHLSITIRHTQLGDLGGLLAGIAANLGIALYDAGKLTEPDETGEVFEDFPTWLTWAPVPKNWKRVA